ncbi:MAG TPA: phospho-N-acetylmuramoyl-pentapeptide-transferase [Candidatus Dormibacteraeota bacterium]|nr:phospho-N-acetylmuramoyl-pentapeptide-transferase [Candidatus Dormibacteraeota bacterium]
MNWLAAAGTFLGTLAVYPLAISGLGRIGLRRVERSDLPRSHMAKIGTPTAGGALFVIALLVTWAIVARDPAGGLVAGGAALGCGAGLVDDVAKVRRGEGVRFRPKLLLLAACAALLTLGVFATSATTQTIPGLGPRDLGLLGLALAGFAILATANAANLTDGVDGLAAGCGIPGLAACAALAMVEHRSQLAVTCACLAAALLAFLFFNRPRARVFMGDAGSLAVGLALAVSAIEVGALVLLPILALVFVAEAGSVIVQLTHVKLTHGRRLFRASPIHHHFEEGGMSEWGIDLRFWAISALAAALGAYWAVAAGLPGGAH